MTYSVIFESEYNKLPISIRMDNSGIYGVDGFSKTDSGIYFLGHDSRQLWQIADDKNALRTFYIQNEDSNSFPKDPYLRRKNLSVLCAVGFSKGKQYSIKQSANGEYLLNEGTLIKLIRSSSNGLKILIEKADFTRKYEIAFPGDLATVDLVGLDSGNNLFVLAERILKQRPLVVTREIHRINLITGSVSAFEVPLQKYLTIVKEFEVDSDGNILQLLSSPNGIRLIQWSSTRLEAGGYYRYPLEMQTKVHYNDFLPKTDPVVSRDIKQNLAVVDRATCLRTAETYVMHRFTCAGSNLAATKIYTPDGDSLQTPPRLSMGINSEISYKWGGFNTLSGFDAGLNAGKYAGDIDCESSSTYAVGVDCSGFVSRCWQLTSHYVTAEMPSICTELAAWDSLRPADAILKDGHVRMFIERTSTGSFRVVESSGRDWGVSYWTYSASDLTAYAPYKYNNMSTSYNTKVPVFTRVLVTSDNKVSCTWSCDTAGIKGYRLYKSTDGVNYSLLFNENTIKNQYHEFQLTDSAACYRISSVKTESTSLIESFWSNVLCYANYAGYKKYLLVHGFTRTGGAWRSTTDDFVTSDFKAMKNWKRKFDSVRNSELLTGITLSGYDAVFWILGDESTANATFSTSEQSLVKSYLESGGSIFVSGSEVGYDLYSQGSASDKSFFNNYLKAQYAADDAASESVTGITGKIFDGCAFNFGQTYAVGTPDEINAYGGSEACIKYSNNKIAGIQFTGKFGSSAKTGKLIYLAFPLESCANDSAIQMVIGRSIKYLSNGGNLTVKFIPAGLYNSAKNALRMRDTFNIYLAAASSPYAIIDSAAVILDSITFSATALFRNAGTGNYYIIIKGRNILETWSKSGGEAYTIDALQSYNFTDAASKAYGNNLALVNSKYCVYSGDISKDGTIDRTDILSVDTDASNYYTGYRATDVNGDGIVDFSDLIIVDNNSNLLITAKKPLK